MNCSTFRRTELNTKQSGSNIKPREMKFLPDFVARQPIFRHSSKTFDFKY